MHYIVLSFAIQLSNLILIMICEANVYFLFTDERIEVQRSKVTLKVTQLISGRSTIWTLVSLMPKAMHLISFVPALNVPFLGNKLSETT